MNDARTVSRLNVLGNDNASRLLLTSAQGDVSTLTPKQRELRAKLPVALVSMPFQSTSRPSIQLGLLSAISESYGFPTETFHLALEFACRIGTDNYEQISGLFQHMMGDWFFANEAFGADSPDDVGRFLEDFQGELASAVGKRNGVITDADKRSLMRIRDEVVPTYLNAMMDEMEWGRFRVIGFSSVFQQTVASLALARRIKAKYPDVCILMGGANLEGDMGYEIFKNSPQIDYVVNGEGDLAFPELLIALAENQRAGDVPGVLSREGGQVRDGGTRPVFEAMDTLPTPNYDEYFRRVEITGAVKPDQLRNIFVPFESARGCWWGAKHHCIFCGLNPSGMRFRAKSPEKVAAELAELCSKHGVFKFSAVDNIVEQDYLRTFFPEQVRAGHDYEFFYEVKSNLRREQVKLLLDANVKLIQPGIESLSSRVLQLMKKGVTAAQNVNLLRWTTHYGIRTLWNVLWGFPGETPEDYAEQVRLVKHLTHLQPPLAPGFPIQMDRFSPLYEQKDSFDVASFKPETGYTYVYPKSFDLYKIAYYFEHTLKNPLPPEAYAELGRSLQAWVELWKSRPEELGPPALTYSYSQAYLQIVDKRGTEEVAFTIEGPAARLYHAASDGPISVARAIAESGVKEDPARVEQTFEELCESGLMMRDGNVFLSLALPATRGR